MTFVVVVISAVVPVVSSSEVLVVRPAGSTCVTMIWQFISNFQLGIIAMLHEIIYRKGSKFKNLLSMRFTVGVFPSHSIHPTGDFLVTLSQYLHQVTCDVHVLFVEERGC